ncbi:hypothetical protein V6N13_129114 [Hibiscus sabdariffa]
MPNNYISGLIPENLGNLRNLEVLNLEDNNLTSFGMSFLPSLTKCRALEELRFSGNPLISAKLPSLVGNLSDSLRIIGAFGCNIRGDIPSEIGNLSLLIEVDLDGNKLTGSIPTTIGGLKELQSLSLSYNKLEGSIPSELCHLNKLAFLFLTSNKLSGPLPACMGDLISLRNLFLGSNMFFSSIPSTLTRLGDLLLLNLSSNSLIGPLPIDIGKWKVVTTMDLSSNQFSSDIPMGIVDLKDLTYFSLSNNQITGFIPESFDMVAHLSDFGIAKLLCKDDSMMQTMTMATIGYMAPEYGTEGIVSTKGERSLKSWVKESISSPLNQVVDTDLFGTIGRERSAINNCALSMLQVGLECSAELPDERLDMKETVTKLKKIKAKLLKDTERVRQKGHF